MQYSFTDSEGTVKSDDFLSLKKDGKSVKIPRYHLIKKSYSLQGIKVWPLKPVSLATESKIQFNATLQYEDGRTADVTEDVTWHVLPTLGTMKENVLEVGCASSDLIVTANFLNEAQGTMTVPVRKTIESLTLARAESTSALEKGEFIQLSLTARCSDGTRTDISCQAQWDVVKAPGRFQGCGLFHIDRALDWENSPIQVRALYGGKSITRSISLPLKH